MTKRGAAAVTIAAVVVVVSGIVGVRAQTAPGELVIDVMGADIQVGEMSSDGRAFAVRDHGRTEALLFVIREGGGWVVERDYSS